LDWSTKGSATIDYLDQNTFEAIYSSSALVYMLIWVRLNNKSTELPPHVGPQRIKPQMFIPPTNVAFESFQRSEDYRMKPVEKKTEPLLKPAKDLKIGWS
jgi:hypothetical protein